MEEQAPLKPALKRSSSQKPALKSILKKSPFHGNISPSYARLNMSYLTMVLGEKKGYYSEDESAKRERGTKDDYFPRCPFLIDIMQNDHRLKVSILLERVRRPHLSVIQAPRAIRPSSVIPPVQGSWCYCEFL